ncbi:MAG: LacI family DNA-binding transcriptional regulator, partial [Tropicimonas sp.]|uniref:LacI family DNA-binding transcriptional regulator n=1 Tax=Tropicimonas sp. TaxID=2067044 RepID=UPI003A88450F
MKEPAEANGKRGARQGKITIKDVAKAAGVSMMTVSNVIHNRPNVGAAQRKHVQGFIDTLGYVPNRAAQELAGVMRPRFGLLYPRYMTPFISAVIVGTLNASAQLNVDVSIQL